MDDSFFRGKLTLSIKWRHEMNLSADKLSKKRAEQFTTNYTYNSNIR